MVYYQFSFDFWLGEEDNNQSMHALLQYSYSI